MQFILVYPQLFRRSLLLKYDSQLKISKKSIKSVFWKSFKVDKLSVNRKALWNFLLLTNSNLDNILHRFWDTATELAQNRIKSKIILYPSYLATSIEMTASKFLEKRYGT